MDGERALDESGACGRGRQSSTADLDDSQASPCKHVDRGFLLELSKSEFTTTLEDVGDAHGRALLDDFVHRDERSSEPLGEHGSERGLPRAHEADERDVPIQCVQNFVQNDRPSRGG